MSLQTLYETILKTNIINFCIMISVLVWIFKKFNLGSIIDNIEYNIANNVTSSAKALEDAISEYKKARKDLRNAPDKSKIIIEEANSTALKLKEKNSVEIQEKELQMNGAFEKNCAVLHERKMQNLTAEIQEAVLNLSKDTIKNMLSYEMQEKIILNSLNELNNRGGQ